MKQVFDSANRRYTIEAFPIGGTEKCGCAIYPAQTARGVALFEVDGEYLHGRLVHFDTDQSAVAGGKAWIQTEFLALRG